MRELILPANLMSLTRIPLAFVLGYFLSQSGNAAPLLSAAVFILAGITDFLDGYLARHHRQITTLGIALDPICDKIFAGVAVIFLILYRDFPIWLAFAILGRDLLIVTGGLVLRRHRDLNLPSNLTGKYAFAAVAVLAGSYIIEYQLGIVIATILTIALLAASTFVYARVFVLVSKGNPVPVFDDRPVFKRLRVSVTLILSAVYLTGLYVDKF